MPDASFSDVDTSKATELYSQERNKRLHKQGNQQFIDISLESAFSNFEADPWADPSAIPDLNALFSGNSCQLLILGAGFGGLLYAVRAIEAGIPANQIRIVDTAGGFGGTWYWNRYPGLACDIESYSYLPLLEQTGYMPKSRYASGHEIREYAELIAEKWGLRESAVFQTQAEKLEWDDSARSWKIDLRQGDQMLTVQSHFVATVNGVLNWPKLPGLPGIHDFKGDVFHSSRWNYAATGGSPADASLTRLKGKRVAIVGTGATSVQLVPHLARWADHLYVVQRTPASVDSRKQRQTDPEWFKTEVAGSRGWQRERCKNFHGFFSTGQHPSINLVDDEWTRATGMVAAAGNPDGPNTMDEIPAYTKKLFDLDLPRQNRIRANIRATVKDHQIADKLLPWYPTWCKRPCFSDEYYTAFNLDNVTLLDTDGKGMDSLSHNSIIVNDEAYEVDMVIFATGYRAPFAGSPAEKANISILGRNGISMSESWAQKGPSTLHGVLDCNFPNLFLSGPWQAALSGNNTFNADMLSKHVAYILTEAEKRAEGKAYTISSTQAGADDWGMQILMRAAPGAAAAGCTPNYFNMEGELDQIPPEAQMQVARSGLWGKGVEDFSDQIEAWRKEGSMAGVAVQF